MKKILNIIKKIISLILKIIIAIMMGLGSSFGKNLFEEENKNNKTIESTK